MGPAWLKRRRQALDGYSEMIFLGGLAAVFISNAISWLRDQRLSAGLRQKRLASRRPDEEWIQAPRVSVLVAAWNEAHWIARHLESLRSLRYPDFEYILCAGGTDGTYEIASEIATEIAIERGDSRVTVFEQRRGEGKQAALQRCLERATGTIIFLTDADCLLDELSFQETIRPVLVDGIDAASGGFRPLPEQLAESGADPLVIFRWSADVYTAAHAPIEVAGISGANAAISRAALTRAGDFRADVPAGTDYHLAKSLRRVNARIRHVGDSAVATEYPANLIAYTRQQRRWLRNVVVLGRQFGAWGDLAAATRTILLGLGMIVTPISAPLVGRWILAGWAVAVMHSAVSKVRYVAFAASLDGAGDRLLRPAVLAWAIPITLLDFVVWSLPILDLPSTRRRRRW